MIEPVLSDDAFLMDVADVAKEPHEFHLWWLGQSGFLVQWQTNHLLIDPYLSDSLTHKYAATDKPHVRMTRRVIAPERLTFVDVVTSSHHHTDHLDADTIKPLLDVVPKLKIVCPEAHRDLVSERLGIERHHAIGVNDCVTVHASGFEITGVPAAHETVEVNELGHHLYLGYVIHFGSWTIYHSGDTVPYEGMADRLRDYPIDVALLPINGRAEARRVAGNLTAVEAATLAHDIHARLVIPCHYEMFEFNTASPDEFIATAEALHQPYRVLRCGERWSSRELRS